jgi:hypothetical protein
MALSNIFREPRREITESVVGIAAAGAVIGGGLWLDYEAALWLGASKADGICLCMAFLPLGVILTAILLMSVLELTHDLGDKLCTRLEAAGIYLRPRQRK